MNRSGLHARLRSFRAKSSHGRACRLLGHHTRSTGPGARQETSSRVALNKEALGGPHEGYGEDVVLVASEPLQGCLDGRAARRWGQGERGSLQQEIRG